MPQAALRHAIEPLVEGARDTGLADPGFAGEQHHLAVALLGLLPALDEKGHLLLAPDQRCRAGRARLEAAADSMLALHAPSADRVGEAP